MPRVFVDQVAKVPTDPGCYLWKDADGAVIYVGKAKNLRARLRQYVTLTDDRAKIPLMMQLVASFDYIVVESEHEALVLERELIAQYHPYFNVDYKDDKSYPYIAITRGDLFPAIKYTRERHRRIRAITVPTPIVAPRERRSTRCARCVLSAPPRVRSGSACAVCSTNAPQMPTLSSSYAHKRGARALTTMWEGARAYAPG